MENYREYEYKSPSYELVNRDYKADLNKHKELRRYHFNSDKGYYESNCMKKDEITLLIAGDLLCQERMLERYKTNDGFDFSYCFNYLKPFFDEADFVCGNLETPISETAPYRGEIITHEGPFFCNAPIQYLEALSEAGFDMLTTANNHTIDAGVRGLIETIDNVKDFGLITTGTFKEKENKYLIVDIKGFKVGFVAFSTTYNEMDANMTDLGYDQLLNTYSKKTAKTIYDELRSKGAEYIVCFPHWGSEYTEKISISQRNMANELTEMGYDCLVGSHSHVIQRFEIINGKPVLFSLGNLISHLNTSKKSAPYTVLFSLKLKKVNNEIISHVEFIPCKIIKDYENIPYTVVPVVNGIPYSKKLNEMLNLTVRNVKELLKNENVVINDNFNVNDKYIEEFEKIEKEWLNKNNLIIPKEKIILPQLVTPKEINDLKSENIVKEKNGYYKVNENDAELVYITTNSGTVRINARIGDKPVTKIANLNGKNDTTRIIYLPSCMKTIGKESFKNYTQLESVRIFNNLESIEDNAFEGCTKLTGLILSKSVKTIGANAFLNCLNLISIKIPANVTYIASSAFEGCVKLTIYCEENSYAEEFAKNNNIQFSYMPLNITRNENLKIKNVKKEVKEMEQVKSTKKFEREIVQKNSMNADVKYGEMNGENDRHPIPVIAACYHLGSPLPEDAVCGKQPSAYIKGKKFDGKLETLKKLIGNKISKIDDEVLVKEFKRFKQKYETQECLAITKVDLFVYFTDYLMYARPRGFSHNDYFDFELYNKEADVRDTFLDEQYRLRIYRLCANKEYRGMFKDKPTFNAKFKGFVNRDWVDASRCEFDEFKAFVEKHEKFFAKPIGRTGGAGARIIERDSDTVENLYKICKEEELLAEEIIQQHEELAKFNESTLNTLRVLTFVDSKKEPHVLLAVGRFGRAGNVVDNFHGGGVGAIVDVNTGVVMTDAINRNHVRSDIHPDSKLKILGFQYPKWDEVLETAKKAALVMPEIRNVGWDVTITKEGNVEIIEGNSRSGFDVLQSPDQTGRKHLYTPYLTEEEKQFLGTEKKPLVINLDKIKKDYLKTKRKKNSLITRIKRFIRRVLKNK